MREANRLLADCARDASCSVSDLARELNSIRTIIGEPSRKQSKGGLKRLGTALLLTPSPEPFSDLLGLALIGAGALADRVGHPLTISELSTEAGPLFRSILRSAADR
ncbi:MAG: hypothetical protein QFX35_01540 [Candidatus Verstraetearchaeota archaeon]|nr:hypothetical protein [Candidatus Verstraetearchaeota archaeon]